MRVPSVLILAITVCTAAFAADEPIVERGEIAGAAFRIDIPADWNGGLLMYAHGYAAAGQDPPFNLNIVKSGHELGYAVAQSRYSRQGWAAREGILDTEALRRYFVAKYGPTFPTVITGHSQGGAITYAMIEQYPEVYDGALPMCSAGPSALGFFKERVFDMRLLFDYYFPGLAGSVVEFPDGTDTSAKVAAKAKELIDADPEKAEWFAKLVNLSTPMAIPGVLGFWSEILRELTERTGGNAFDNTDTIYSGTDDDIKLNREIPRHAADSKSVEYLRQWVTMTGEISDPVLAVHTIVDDLIPPPIANAYGQLTALAGTSDLYVQSWTGGKTHCAFTEEETTESLRQLTAWIKDGKRPAPSDLSAAK